MTDQHTPLKPCPFCDSEAKLQSFTMNRPPQRETHYYCECSNRDHCDTSQAVFVNAEAAIEAWNKRAYEAALAATNQRIAELEETLQFAAQYKGIEGRSCPLCRYENGVFLGPCQMHADMDRMLDTIAELEAQLAERWVPMEAYCEIYIDGEDGQKYTIGIDGDDNLFVRRRDARDAIVVLPSDEYRLCRQVQAGEVE